MNRALQRHPARFNLSHLAVALALAASATVGCGDSKKAPPASGAANNPPANVLPPKTPQPLDLSYIPADAVLAVVLDPYQLQKSPNLVDAKVESFSPQILAETGIDPAKVAQAMLVGGLEDKGPPISYGFIVRFKDPYSREAILANVVPDSETAKAGDREYHRAKSAGAAAVFFADDKTLLIAPEAALKKMMAAKDVKSVLLTELAKHDDTSAALAVLAIEPIRGKIQGLMFLGAIPKPAAPLDGLLKAVQHVSVVEFNLEVTPQLAVRARIRGKNEESAVEVEKIVNQVLEKTKFMLSEAAKGGGGASQQDGQAARFIQLVANRFFSALKQNRDKDTLEYDAEGEGVQAQVTLFGPLLVREYQSARDRELQTATFDRMKKIGVAMLAYEVDHGKFPPAASHSADGKPLLSWRVLLLPYLDPPSQALYKEFNLAEPWDSQHNRPLATRMPQVFQTPGRPRDGKTSYLAPLSKSTMFPGVEGVHRSEITDPVANTVALVQAAPDRAVEWTRPDDLKFDAAVPMEGLGGLQITGDTVGLRDGIPALFADGAVRLLKWNLPPKDMAGFFTRAGGESPPKDL